MKKLLIIIAAAIAFSCSSNKSIDAKAIEKFQTFYKSYIFS